MSIDQDTYIIIDRNDEDDEELIDHCRSLAIPTKRLSSDAMLDLKDLHRVEVLFANTQTIQALLPHYHTPDTYPPCFQDLYRRKIDILSKEETLAHPLPVFVKPRGNSKSFTGLVVRDHFDLEVIKVSPDEAFYVCEVVQFQSEFRLFVGVSGEQRQPNLFGLVESTQFISGKPNGQTASPPQDLIDDILRSNALGFCVVDVGLTAQNVWCCVEVNPPFALTSYDWPIDQYYDYCQKAWKYIVNNNKQQP